MPNNLIRNSCFEYLQQWYRTDRQLMGATTTVEEVRNLAIKYMVVRNFKISDLNLKELNAKWEKVVKCVAKAQNENKQDTTSMVNKLAEDIGGIFPTAIGKTQPVLISAASKFLWFSGVHQVRIYDKRAVNALKIMQRERTSKDGIKRKLQLNGNYSSFENAWNEEYADFASEIKDVTKDFDKILNWTIIPDGEWCKEALNVSKKAWFRDRVFDKFLWTSGESA